MNTLTYGGALARIATQVPDHLIADAEIPVLTEPQAQGDLLIIPIDGPGVAWQPLDAEGHQVVTGEATGNTHWLHPGFDSPGVEFARVDDDLRLVVVKIPEGQSAVLAHTDEHGCNAMGVGTYAIHGKREQRDVVERVRD